MLFAITKNICTCGRGLFVYWVCYGQGGLRKISHRAIVSVCLREPLWASFIYCILLYVHICFLLLDMYAGMSVHTFILSRMWWLEGMGSKKHPVHCLVAHGTLPIRDAPPVGHLQLLTWLRESDHGKVEGIVWHCRDGALFKVIILSVHICFWPYSVV